MLPDGLLGASRFRAVCEHDVITCPVDPDATLLYDASEEGY
jgi:hypothetical protein